MCRTGWNLHQEDQLEVQHSGGRINHKKKNITVLYIFTHIIIYTVPTDKCTLPAQYSMWHSTSQSAPLSNLRQSVRQKLSLNSRIISISFPIKLVSYIELKKMYQKMSIAFIKRVTKPLAAKFNCTAKLSCILKTFIFIICTKDAKWMTSITAQYNWGQLFVCISRLNVKPGLELKATSHFIKFSLIIRVKAPSWHQSYSDIKKLPHSFLKIL